MNKFKAPKIKEGEDWIKLSFIFNRTTKPDSINRHKPVDANKSNKGLK